MTIALHPVDDPSRYGVVATAEDGAVTAFIEKPPPGSTPVRTINAGTYVAEPDVLDLVPPGRAVSVEYDVFPRLVGEGLYALSDEGAWRDIGTPESFLAANLERMPPGGLVDPTAVVDPQAVVEGSVVGPGCRIEAGAHIHGSVVLAGALVAAGMTMDNLVVGRTGDPVW
jgi:mannose-1-phosphate guanylyltransferase